MLEVGDRGEGKNARPWMSNRMEAEASEGSVSENMEADETRRKAVREGSEIGFMLPDSGRKSRPDSGNIKPIFSLSRLGRSIHAAPESGRDWRPDSGRKIAPEFRAEINRFDIGRWNPGAVKNGACATFCVGWRVRRNRYLYNEVKATGDVLFRE